jgi:uncharacterized membrane protein
MSKMRTVSTFLLCGFGTLVLNAVVEGEWPDYRARFWLVFITGLVVMAVVWIMIESVVAAKKRDSADASS